MTERLLSDVEDNYRLINERIAEAAEKSGRKREDITFLAATKTVDAEVINYAISLGLDTSVKTRCRSCCPNMKNTTLLTHPCNL